MLKPRRHKCEVGMKIGRLLVLDIIRTAPGTDNKVRCLCDCGNETTIARHSFVSEHTKSCGCYQLESRTKHGLHGSPTYNTWDGMIQRTTNPNSSGYPGYGGRGITLDPKWRTFEGFLQEMGERPVNSQLDRIDNSKGYTKDNCRWVTIKQQSRNKRNTIYVEWQGRTRVLRELADEYEISRRALYMRIVNMGWDVKRALTQPLQKRRHNHSS